MARKISVISIHHQWAYKELAESIKDALIIFGFEAECYNEIKYQTDFNIFISGQALGVSDSAINIIYETDHIFKSPAQRPIDFVRYTRSLHWFDYKQDLTDQNIYYCPIGYSKYFDTHLIKRDLRPNFHLGRTAPTGFGSCRHLFRTKHDLFSIPRPGSPQIMGDERDEIIVTSKVNINSKFHDNYAFTPLHAALILCKGKMLLQEDYGLDDYNWYKPYLILFDEFDEADFRSKLDYWVSHDKERHDFEQFIHEDIKKNHKFEDIFYDAIGDLLEQYR
jgi:hypothetical protein